MRRPARRMLSLMGWLLTGLGAVALGGCQSTSMTRDPNAQSAKQLAQEGSPTSREISWQRPSQSSSSVFASNNSARSPKDNTWVQPTSLQAQPTPTSEPSAIPDLMPKDQFVPPAPQVIPGPSLPVKHFGKPCAVPQGILPNAPTEWNLTSLPSYVIRPPDVLLIELMPQFKRKDLDPKIEIDKIGLNQPILGPHPVGPDGTINLGIYGNILVAGKTVQEAREEVARAVHGRLDQKVVTFEQVVNNLKMSVTAYNSSVYYVITDGAGLGQQVFRLPVTGNETVLDAIAHINGLPLVASQQRIWVARRNLGSAPDAKLPVDWKGITQYGAMNTNWQLMPGDRVFVHCDRMRLFNNNLGKMLEPIERLMGATLLGSQTVNTIKNGTTVIR
jgi:polysaccharide biosynthesis/export protein